jgi:hypothetical protein
MPGWIEQWYWKLPAVWKVRLKVRPGPITPESHAPPLAVDVCEVLSLLVHVTVPPTGTVMGFGANAVVVSTDAPLTMETDDPPPSPPGAGEGAAGDEEPQA